jgi:hypothetical protein
MNKTNFENSNVTSATFNIGLISTLLFIFVNILSSITSVKVDSDAGLPGIIRLLIYYFLYASIWYVMREILVKVLRLTHMYNVTTWLIRLVIISGLLTASVDVIKSDNFLVLLFIAGLALLGFFINFMIRIMQLNQVELPEIKYLRYFVIGFIILFFVLMVVEVVQYQYHINLKLISNLLYPVPFIFVYFFFKEVKVLYINRDSQDQ